MYDPFNQQEAGGGKAPDQRRNGLDASSGNLVYSLKVYPGDQPARNPRQPWLTIEIRCDQSLNDLHRAIEPAFGRSGDCPYRFLFVSETQDKEMDIVCYGSAGQDDREAAVEDFPFAVGDRFTYLLFPSPGQDLPHIVEVMDIRRERRGAGIYPLARPGEASEEKEKSLAGRPKPAKVYTFKVYLGRKLKKRPRLWRLIVIRGDQTLDTLHEAIYDAFDRWDEHLYSFYIGGAEFTVPEEQPGLLGLARGFFRETPEHDAKKTALDNLGLGIGDWFTYLFDFGDEWWHVVELIGVEEESEDTEYPVVVEKRGESPPQYPEDEWDEES